MAGAGDVIGTTPPEWQVAPWINSEPLDLTALKGKVVLVRWWTAPDCRFCAATAPALNEFHDRYRSKGLQVIGFYHHKAKSALDANEVKNAANRFGFTFPVAIDPDWQTLKKWWLDSHNEGYTSISVLLDRKGVIRHAHPGGQYVKGDAAYAALQAKIVELLAEK